MTPYSVLARFYDRLNTADYGKVKHLIDALFAEYGIPPRATLLDLACGTGSLTCRYAVEGYDMIGVDLSPEMLAEAQNNAAQTGVFPLFLCQDMRKLDLYGTVDGGFCLFDSMNYLPHEQDLVTVFGRLKHFIAPGGIFVFDLNTKRKFETTYGDRTYVFDEKDLYAVWENEYRPEAGTCDFYLTFFVKDTQGRYVRMEEHQKERIFSDAILEEAFAAGHFEPLHVYGDTQRTLATPADERRYYVVRRKRD